MKVANLVGSVGSSLVRAASVYAAPTDNKQPVAA
jgi:hypothetical protein